MRLLTKEKLLQTPVYVLIFVLVGVGFYLAAQIVLHEDVESILKARKRYLLQNLNNVEELLQAQKHSFNTLRIEPTSLPPTKEDILYDTLFYNNFEQKYELSTKLIFITSAKGKNYKITLTRAIVNSSQWAVSIAQVILLFLIILLLLLSIANAFISKKLWEPFYGILEKVRTFKISESNTVTFPSTNIEEFVQLSEALQKMMDKMKADYVNLKKFSENASHEFQTPLAVIKIKLDLLLQSSHLSEEDLQLVHSALKSVKKLSKLNEALLLLTKIENRQYLDVRSVDLRKVIQEKVENLYELIKLKNISLNTELTHPFIVRMHPTLADLLIENLLSNAIKHNYDNGDIYISCTGNELQIINTGETLSISTDQLFERFTKSNQNSTSLGLGLAIIKEICNTYQLNIQYENQRRRHITTLHLIKKQIENKKGTNNRLMPYV